MSPAGQWGLARSLRVVPGVDDERADGIPVASACCPHDAGSPWTGASGPRGLLREEVPPGAADRRRSLGAPFARREPPTVFL
jgi:hypothetical protein